MWATSTKTIAMMLIVYYDTDMEEEDTKGIEAHNKCKITKKNEQNEIEPKNVAWTDVTD